MDRQKMRTLRSFMRNSLTGWRTAQEREFFRYYPVSYRVNQSGQQQTVIYTIMREQVANTGYNVNLFILNGGRTMSSSEVTRVVAAAVTAGTKGGVEQRYQQPDYIDVSGGTGSPQYELLGFGVTQLDNSPAAKTSSKRYVNQKSATQSIGSYEWTAPLEFDLIRSEKAIAFIVDIGENEKTGAEAETLYVKVYMNKPVDSKANTFEAKRRRVTIEVADFSDNDGEIQGSGNLLAVSDWVEGTFDTTTKTFTEKGVAA